MLLSKAKALRHIKAFFCSHSWMRCCWGHCLIGNGTYFIIELVWFCKTHCLQHFSNKIELGVVLIREDIVLNKLLVFIGAMNFSIDFTFLFVQNTNIILISRSTSILASIQNKTNHLICILKYPIFKNYNLGISMIDITLFKPANAINHLTCIIKNFRSSIVARA